MAHLWARAYPTFLASDPPVPSRVVRHNSTSGLPTAAKPQVNHSCLWNPTRHMKAVVAHPNVLLRADLMVTFRHLRA